MAKYGKLFLIPNVLADETALQIMGKQIVDVVNHTRFYIAEHAKVARHYLKALGIVQPLPSLQIVELNQHTAAAEAQNFLQPALQGYDVGLISDAGCPAVADPGALMVAKAHQLGIEVVPLVGPSSIIMALMASGANGQQFAFCGYLPIEKIAQKKRLLELQTMAEKYKQSQIFIETPYRNNQLMEHILQTCKPQTMLCVAANLTAPNQFVQSQTIAHWKANKPDLHKQPTVFVLF